MSNLERSQGHLVRACDKARSQLYDGTGTQRVALQEPNSLVIGVRLVLHVDGSALCCIVVGLRQSVGNLADFARRETRTKKMSDRMRCQCRGRRLVSQVRELVPLITSIVASNFEVRWGGNP